MSSPLRDVVPGGEKKIKINKKIRDNKKVGSSAQTMILNPNKHILVLLLSRVAPSRPPSWQHLSKHKVFTGKCNNWGIVMLTVVVLPAWLDPLSRLFWVSSLDQFQSFQPPRHCGG